MTFVKPAAGIVLVCSCMCLCAPRPVAQGVPVDAEQAALVEFNRRVNAYVTLHRTLEGPVPTPAVSADPAEIRAAMDALAARIVRARPFARMGDVITGDVSAIMREVIYRAFPGSGRELLAIIDEEQRGGSVPLPRVNSRWPEGAAFSMVPPKILEQLPRLPAELQYRFRRRHLVLWDMHADLIVDVLPNAIGRLTAP